MKLFKASVILQSIYCLGCVIAIAFLLLFRAFYATEVGNFFFKISEFFAITSALNPIGLVGSILGWIAFFTSNLKKSKKALAWIILSPLLVTALWFIEISLFVHLTGGV